MKFYEFLEAINKTLIITKYPGRSSFSADIEYAEIEISGRCLQGVYMEGATPVLAIKALMEYVKGKKLIFNATDKKRRLELNVPKNLTLNKC